VRADGYAYFAGPRPIAFAHRGGSKTWPENTLTAFEGAIARGCRYIEIDLQRTRDGALVVCHDDTLERTTDGRGPIAAHTLATLQTLDAGYWHTTDGHTYPFRGRGIFIPTLEQALALAPDVRFNLEMKPRGPAMARATWEFVRARSDRERLLVASAHSPTVAGFRHLSDGAVATSAGAAEIFAFWLAAKLSLPHAPRYQALQVPVKHGPLTVISPGFVRAAHERGMHVHVWTIDEPAEMRRLLALGVDGLMSDVPALLVDVINRANGAPTPPTRAQTR
jgi:glycerophosphoryl diester phosphodiesterase